MKTNHLLSAAILAMLFSTSAWAQDDCLGGQYESTGTAKNCCPKAWNYHRASGLWGGYCNEQCGNDGCGLFSGGLGCLGRLGGGGNLGYNDAVGCGSDHGDCGQGDSCHDQSCGCGFQLDGSRLRGLFSHSLFQRSCQQGCGNDDCGGHSLFGNRSAGCGQCDGFTAWPTNCAQDCCSSGQACAHGFNLFRHLGCGHSGLRLRGFGRCNDCDQGCSGQCGGCN